MRQIRPEPITSHRAHQTNHDNLSVKIHRVIRNHEQIIITDSYQTGAQALSLLEQSLPQPSQKSSYQERNEYEKKKRTILLRVLVPIENHELALEGERYIGFLKELYPDISSFTLPLLVVQELHNAWYRYSHGVHMPVLGHNIHPYWGTYAPTRTEHLELFGTWLHQNKKAFQSSIDVGTGSGILALMLRKAGIRRIHATDNNPNALESVRRECLRHEHPTPISLHSTDLLVGMPSCDLIVFNPPWIPGAVHDAFDAALYFDDDIFTRFFDQAHALLPQHGSIVLLFSNIMTLLRPDIAHPIEEELKKGRFQCIQKLQRKIKPKDKTKRTKEKVQVWELKHR